MTHIVAKSSPSESDSILGNSPAAYISKTYDVYYQADNIEEVLNEKIEFNSDVSVENALKASIKIFNRILK